MAGDQYDASYEQQCPACKTTKYRNPQMKLMVNVCGHALCDSCVKLLFIKESGQCPECDMVLKRSKFRTQIFEDPIVEKEIDIRRRVMKIFCKQEDDFNILEEFNNYLEDIEETVFNLTFDINKIETEKRLENLERQNRDEIKRSFTKRNQEDEELERLVDDEKVKQIQRRQLDMEEEKTAALKKAKNHSSLLEDLMSSEGDASLIVKSHAERLRLEQEKDREQQLLRKVEEKQTKSQMFSSGVKFGLPNITGNLESQLLNNSNYNYENPFLSSNSLPAPTLEDLETSGYLQHIRKVPSQSYAGGYTEYLACLRIIQDYMWGHVLPISK